MTRGNWGRRNFIRSLAGSAAGLGLIGRFEEVAAEVDDRLEALPSRLDTFDEIARLRREYLLDPRIVYLNHASIGTVPRAVHEARTGYTTICESNPWLYMWGGEWEGAREDAREVLATYLGSTPSRMAITHNTTEGFNVLAGGLPLGSGDEVLFSELNHDGASVCFERWAERKGFSVRRAPFPMEDAASMDEDAILEATLAPIRDETRVLVLPHIDNMIGIRAPVARIVEGAKARGVQWVFVDGAQTAGMIPLALDDWGVDAYAGSPHKWIQTPKGLGFLHLSDELHQVVEPMWVTWGQDRWDGARRFEDYGTRNLAEVVALGDAVAWQTRLEADGAKEDRLRRIHARIRDRVEASSRLVWRSPKSFDDGGSLVAIEVRGVAATEVGARLNRDHGVVLRTFGGERLNTLRVSPNLMTSDPEIDAFLTQLETSDA